MKYIQIDAPRYSYYIDPKWRQYIKDEMGLDPEQALDEAIHVDNVETQEAQKRIFMLSSCAFCVLLCASCALFSICCAKPRAH